MSDIPTAEQLYQEELKQVNEQETYEFQKKLVVEEITKINKNNSSICVCFKAHPHSQLVKEIEENGYQIKFEVMYDSSKVEKYQTRMRVINPKFVTGAGNFMDKLEDQMKGCAFAQTNVQVSEDTKKLMESLFNSFMGK
jgi:hypothetical protein